MEFIFEPTPWELALNNLHSGDKIFAVDCLDLLEALSEEETQQALLLLEEQGIALDVSSLPKISAGGENAVRLKLEEKLAKSGNLLQGLEENDPLRLYLEELAAIPAQGDIALLAERYTRGDENAQQQLVNLSLRRVVERACEMTGRGVLLLDLIQEGSMGLWQGTLCYTGGDYANHTNWWISQYLAKAVLLQAHCNGIGQRLRRGMEDYRDADQQLLSQLGRNPTLEEIAEAIHVTPEEAATFREMLTQAKAREQLEQLRQPREETADDQQAVENTAYFQTRQRIAEMLSTLTEQQARVLTLRFGLEEGAALSEVQVGKMLGLTPEAVTEIERQSLLKLRQNEGGKENG